MKVGDVDHAKPPPEWQPETLDLSKRTVIWKLQKSLYCLRNAPRRWHDHLEQILKKCGFVPTMLDTCLWTHTTKRVSLVFHVDDMLLAGTHHVIKEILTELSRHLELQSSEVTTKPTRNLGPNLVKRRSGTTLELMLRMWNACWRSSTSPRSRVHQHCDGNVAKEMSASEQRVYRQLVGKMLWIDRADLRCAIEKASSRT